MFEKSKITYIGDTILQPGRHIVLVVDYKFMSPFKGDNCQIFVPEGYRFVNYSHAYSRTSSFCYENVEPVKVKVYSKKDKKFCPEFGIPVR